VETSLKRIDAASPAGWPPLSVHSMTVVTLLMSDVTYISSAGSRGIVVMLFHSAACESNHAGCHSSRKEKHIL
jgi:hypothetical protein